MNKKFTFPKINSINFATPWLLIGFGIGVVIPAVGYLICHVVWWPLCIIGGMILLAFVVVFVIEMNQDFGKVPYYQKHLAELIPYDETKQVAVIKCSICNGEQVAGFKNIEDGSWTEVMLIRDDVDLENFKKAYGISSIKKEY